MGQAGGFLGAQLAAGLAVLVSLPNTAECVKVGMAAMPLVVLYPTAKRWTGHPQLVLGLTFNWGCFVGWTAATGVIDPLPCLPMYAAGVGWTLLYDTLYAHQDKVDDREVGVKSTALTWGDTKAPLYASASAFGLGMVAQGVVCDVASPYYGFLALATSHLLWQVRTADLDDPENLGERFKSNQTVGALVTAGCLAGVFF
mmetsp:Transcript_13164/g.26147  ORF Transcript_13164/g.26147 Transcript_13164/m.26147 type:complete len:200 (+) Transcript_13164:1-600(+)